MSEPHNHSDHTHNDEHSEISHAQHHGSQSSMALAATLHCLTGCTIGEILGMILSISFGLSNLATIIISIILAFVFGYSLSATPLLKTRLSFTQALKLVLLADTLSILVMELAENTVMLIIPGSMSSIATPLFWVAMTISLTVGFTVAYPVNPTLLNKGKGHAITHQAVGHHSMNNKPLLFGIIGFLLGGFLTALLG